MRKLYVGMIGAAVLLSLGAGPAGAITFDLKFQSSGGVCTAGATTCAALPGATVAVDVVFTINVNRIFTFTSVGLDLSAMGLANTAVTATAFDPPFPGTAITMNGVVHPVGGTTVLPLPLGDPEDDLYFAPCTAKLPGCDHRFTSFGYVNPTSVGSGFTYTAGTITLDLTGANPGTWTIAPFFAPGVDGPPDNANNPHNVAILTIVPEPATAALLGGGLVGLAVASRSSRPRGR